MSITHEGFTREPTFCRRSPRIATSAFKPGQLVTIFCFGHFRRPYIEGRGRICSAIPGKPGLYNVRFEGERRTRERLVHAGDWQTYPDRLLKQLTASWQASLTPALLREFFADEVRLEEAQP